MVYRQGTAARVRVRRHHRVNLSGQYGAERSCSCCLEEGSRGWMPSHRRSRGPSYFIRRVTHPCSNAVEQGSELSVQHWRVPTVSRFAARCGLCGAAPSGKEGVYLRCLLAEVKPSSRENTSDRRWPRYRGGHHRIGTTPPQRCRRRRPQHPVCTRCPCCCF